MYFYFPKPVAVPIRQPHSVQTKFNQPMKINQILALAVALIFLGLNTAAHADDEADRDALRLIRTNYMNAVNSGDLSLIKNDLSQEVTGVMVTGKPVAGFDGLVAYWKEVQGLIGQGGTYHVIVNVDKTDLFGDVSVSHGTTEETVRLASGKELDFSAYWTAVCHKENGEWKVVRMQATLNPIDNVFVSLRIKEMESVYGGIGFIAGILVVLAVRLVLCGRSRAERLKAV
jgi:ketosteroid isomerase-like protein